MSPLAPTSPNPLSVLFSRDITGDAAQAAYTLSSWDHCMAVSYCKWPVIVAIVLGSLFVLSIVICCARCLCCGLECCCWCCSCFNRCCPSPRNKKAKYSEAPQYQYPPQQPYGYHPSMSYGPPQFAVFDASNGKPKEDSLPAMPSWQNAATHKIEDPNYRGVDPDDVADKEMSGGNGIAMHNVSTTPKQPVQYYVEEPDESHQPMLAAHQRNFSQEQVQGYSQDQDHAQGYPQDHVQGYSQGYAPQAQYIDDNLAYNQHDNASSYAGTDLGQPHAYGNPSHPYSHYNQQQDSYSNYTYDAATSPTSTYTNTYPPTYHTRASTVRPQYAPQQIQPESSYHTSQSPPLAQRSPGPSSYQNYRGPSLQDTQDAYYNNANNNTTNFSRSPSAAYAPRSPGYSMAPEDRLPEMPGSLVPGSGHRAHSSRTSQDLNRKPVGGSGW